MPVIKDEKSLKAWLETRPGSEARLIAARAALRALPALASIYSIEKIANPSAIALAVFRATSVAHVGKPRSASRSKVRKAAASAAFAADEAASQTIYSTGFSAANAAASAAFSVADAATEPAARAASFAAARSGARAEAWSAVERDAERLEAGNPRAELLTAPLWPYGLPDSLTDDWPTLCRKLLESDPLWRVWTVWYQDRLDGKPTIEALEIQKALIPNEDWEQGPAHVNAIIAELIEKHSPQEVPELPEPAPTPTDYIFTGEFLEIVDTEAAAAPNDATEIAWSVLRETLNRLKAGGVSNSMRVAPAIDRTLVALGDAPDQVDIIRCGMAGMELQAFSEVADNVLMEDAAAMLKAAVAQHALLVAQFEEWQEFRAQLLPPIGGRQSEREAVRDAAELHHELAEDGLLSDAADARMSEEEAAALPEPAVTGEAVTAEPESERGFLRSVRAAVRAFAADVLSKMRENAVKASAIGIPTGAGLVFVRYSDTLTALATKLPTEFGWVLQWIQWLKAALV